MGTARQERKGALRHLTRIADGKVYDTATPARHKVRKSTSRENLSAQVLGEKCTSKAPGQEGSPENLKGPGTKATEEVLVSPLFYKAGWHW